MTLLPSVYTPKDPQVFCQFNMLQCQHLMQFSVRYIQIFFGAHTGHVIRVIGSCLGYDLVTGIPMGSSTPLAGLGPNKCLTFMPSSIINIFSNKTTISFFNYHVIN